MLNNQMVNWTVKIGIHGINPAGLDDGSLLRRAQSAGAAGAMAALSEITGAARRKPRAHPLPARNGYKWGYHGFRLWG